MKVVLINPPVRQSFEIQSALGLNAPPLGLAYIGAVLERDGYDVTIIDAPISCESQEGVIKKLQSIKPDVIGVTSMTPNIGDAVSLITKIKQKMPNPVTVLGGCHITFMPEETMDACPAIDVGVIGEGEVTMLEIVRSIESGRPLDAVDGIVIRDRGKIRRTRPRRLIEDLDTLPFPARHLLPMEKYTALGERTPIGNVITSRGCPFRCIFCASSRLYGNTFRARSAENVVEEVSELVDKYRINFIEFVDDTFTINKKRSFRLADLLRKLDVFWAFGSRVDTVSEELLRAFRRAGALMFYMGIESASERVLRFLKKGITLEQIRSAISSAKKAGLETTGSFIIGTPGEKKEEAIETIKFAISSGIDYAQFTAMTPYPGTEVYEFAKMNRLLETEDWSKYTTIKPVMRTFEMTAEEIRSLISMAYRKFYLRPKFLVMQVAKKRILVLKPILRRYLAKRSS
ncbi:MAG: radical SAM protein [Candidatus Verstraetearchaeota archaeon]|nr:radical SAM protein [Candidatus Verstraetearchaeota archaeon]